MSRLLQLQLHLNNPETSREEEEKEEEKSRRRRSSRRRSAGSEETSGPVWKHDPGSTRKASLITGVITPNCADDKVVNTRGHQLNVHARARK